MKTLIYFLSVFVCVAAAPQYMDVTPGAGDTGIRGGTKINENLAALLAGDYPFTNLSVLQLMYINQLYGTNLLGTPAITNLTNAGHDHTNMASGRALPNYASVVLWRNGLPWGYTHITNAWPYVQSGDAVQLRSGDHWVQAGATTAAPLTLDAKSNITIYGEGWGTRLCYTNEGDVMYFDTCTNIIVRDLAIVAMTNLEMTNHNYLWSAIHIADKTSYCLFENLYIYGAPDHCISRPTGEKKCAFNVVKDCKFEKCGDDRYGDERLAVTMTFTDVPSAGNTFILYLQGNADTNMLTYTRYWTNSGANGASWILAGSSAAASATNAYTYIATNKSALINIAYASSTAITFSLPTTTLAESMTNDVTGTYAIDAYSLAGSDGTAISGIGEGWLITGNRFVFCLRDIEIENLGQPASLPRNVICTQNYHEDTGSFCYWIFSATNALASNLRPYVGNIMIHDNVMRRITNSAMRIDGGYDISIQGNLIEGVTNATTGTGNGIILLSASSRMENVSIKGNTVIGIKVRGISVAHSTYPTTNVIIEGNFVESYGGSYAGIEVLARNVIVANNVIKVMSGGSANSCVVLHDQISGGGTNVAADVLVYGNTFIPQTLSASVAGVYVQQYASNITVGPNVYLNLYPTNYVYVRPVTGEYVDNRNIKLTAPLFGTGSPQTVLPSPVGTVWMRTDGGAGATMYVKEVSTNYVDYWNWAAK
jgi:hypothetical protein